MFDRLRWVPVFVLALWLVPSLARADSACDAVQAPHAKDTVIVFTPPSSFAICQGGSEQDDVVTGRAVYVQLVANPGVSMFRFRIHGQAAEPKVTGLREIRRGVRSLGDTLTDLAHSGEHISELQAGEAGALGGARTRYLGVATRRFTDALASAHTKVHDLKDAVHVVDRWCRDLHSVSAQSSELQEACRSARSLGDADRDVTAFDESGKAFDDARDLAREALVKAAAHPDDAGAAGDAARLLDLARVAASALVRESAGLAVMARTVSHDLGELRTAIGSLGALRPGVPTYLTTYGESGNAVLGIDAIPIAIDVDDRSADETNASFRFAIVGRHYFDVEVGAGITGGQPDIPSITSNGGTATIDSKPVDEFLALALVELEPMRFAWPDKPLAGLLRFPVIGIPLSRDPTENFFVGAGIGWTGIGSITAGPYLLRELELNAGHNVGDSLPGGTSLRAITTPTVNVGFYVSASIDVVGLFRLFVHEHEPTLDAATGRER